MLSVTRKAALTLYFWTGVVIATALTGIAYCCAKVLSPWNQLISEHDLITYIIENVMAQIILLWMTTPGFWKVEYSTMGKLHGKAPRDSDGPFLLAANHNSLIDTLFISDLNYKKSYSYSSKWGYVPVFGWLCVLAGYISIDTTSPEKRAEVVPKVVNAIRNGYSVMVYPQGTRSRTPNAKLYQSDVKTGAFRVAAETQCQILPIAIRGSDKIVSRRGVVDCGTVDIIYCDPISGDNPIKLLNEWIDTINRALRAEH